MKNKNKQTKFPVARIKKIMQKDEEVGKVAQATPVVISKALELFLGMLVDETSSVTLERNSKRVEVYHLKHAVERTDMLDFLKEIVAGVPDPSAGGTIDVEAEKSEAKKRRAQGTSSASAAASAAAGAGGLRKRRKKGKDGVKAEGDAYDEGSGTGNGNGNGNGSGGGWHTERGGAAADEGEGGGEEAEADDGGDEAYSDREQWD